jgi:5'-phosphate synthase pdxT subunit
VSDMDVGVLALQGASKPHLAAFSRVGVEAREVRSRDDLARVSHLVIPGGESTTIRHLLDLFGMSEAIVAAHRDGRLALLGTCAGAILLGQDDGTRPRRLALLDATLARNAYGRQVDSFSAELALELPGERGAAPFHGVFIRAPRFARLGPGVRVVARRGEDPVLVEAQGVMAATFHPELTDDLRIHRRFLATAPAAARSAAA